MPDIEVTVTYTVDVPQEILDDPELLEELKQEIDGGVLVTSFTTSVVKVDEDDDDAETEYEVEVETGDSTYQLAAAPYTMY